MCIFTGVTHASQSRGSSSMWGLAGPTGCKAQAVEANGPRYEAGEVPNAPSLSFFHIKVTSASQGVERIFQFRFGASP